MTLATALAIGGVALKAYGHVKGAQAQEAQALAMRQQSLYNAQLDERNARAAELKAKFDQIRQQRYAQGVMGRLRARLGASGAVTTTGAPVALLAEQASELALENALIGYEGLETAKQYRSQATLRRYQADVYKDRAKAIKRAGQIGVGTTLLSGFSQMGQQGMLGDSFAGMKWRT